MKTHSNYWRKNCSRQKALELALGLRALRKVAGHIGDNAKPVYWKGMEGTDDDSILLDLDLLPDKFPISPEDFDFLVAKVALEGLAVTESTDQVMEEVQKSIVNLPAAAVPFLSAFLKAAEDVYIDTFSRSSVWSLYLAEFWNRTLEGLERDPLLPPSPESLFQVWRKKAILGQEPEQLHLNYYAPLEVLESLSQSLQELADMSTSQERICRRPDLYKKIWSELWEKISKWDMFHLNRDSAPKPDFPENVTADEKQSHEVSPLASELANEISWILEEGEVDLTREILSVIQDPAAKSLKTFLKKGSDPMDFQPEPEQVKRLRKIFRDHITQVRQARNRNIRRGLPEGKLDPRRLYRVPIDGKTFKTKQAPGFEDLWQICIVADASASMAGKGRNMRPWRIAERTFATVIEASREFRNRIDIYAYFGESKNCILTRLYHDNRLYTVTPYGDTPSGQAIMAAASMIDRKYKKNMIVHITDGAPNSGMPMTDAVNYCENKGIQVFTIGCGCTPFTQHFLKESFPPGCVYLMKSIDYLSEGLETLFKQHILKKLRTPIKIETSQGRELSKELRRN